VCSTQALPLLNEPCYESFACRRSSLALLASCQRSLFSSLRAFNWLWYQLTLSFRSSTLPFRRPISESFSLSMSFRSSSRAFLNSFSNTLHQCHLCFSMRISDAPPRVWLATCRANWMQSSQFFMCIGMWVVSWTSHSGSKPESIVATSSWTDGDVGCFVDVLFPA
jgi:hypothetical protein